MSDGPGKNDPSDKNANPASRELLGIRDEIDRTDDEILALLNRRAGYVARVAELKEQMKVPFYVPSRERQIVERLSASNPGPFPTEAIRSVFQEVFSACLSLERTGTSGPKARSRTWRSSTRSACRRAGCP